MEQLDGKSTFYRPLCVPAMIKWDELGDWKDLEKGIFHIAMELGRLQDEYT